MHLSALQSKSQAQGVNQGKLIEKDARTLHDPASEEIEKRRR